jgi:Flp pilus assembly protein TadG
MLVPFFAILFAIIDYAQIYFYDNSLQNGLREASRFASAGRVIQNGTNYELNTNYGVEVPQAINDSSGREASRNECIRYWFQSNCIIAIPISNITIYSATVPAGSPPVVMTNNGMLHLVSSLTVTTNGSVVSTNVSPAAIGPGGQNDYVQIIATYNIQTITPIFQWMGGYNGRAISGGYPLRCSAIVKNEPAALNFDHTNIYPGEPNEATNNELQ